MTKDFGIQFSFSAGELSKRTWGRFDIPQYKSGCERIENFIVYPQGNVSFRNGFVFSSETKDNKIAMVHQYHYKDEYYVLEYTDKTIRVHDKDGLVTLGIVGAGITALQRTGNLVTFTVSGTTTLAVNDYVIIKGVKGCTELNDRILKIKTANSNTFTCDIEGSWDTNFPYTGLGSIQKVLEIETPFEEKDLFELQLAQTATELYIAHRLYAPQVFSYKSAGQVISIGDFVTTGGVDFRIEPPSGVTFFENRLYFGGSNLEPQAIWFSKAGDTEDFTIGTNLADGGKYVLSATDASVIKFLSATSKLLIIGTSGGIYGATTATETTSFEVRPIDGFPVERINPILKDNKIISVQAGARKIRSLNYSFQSDGYVSNDLNIASEDITQGNIKQISYLEGSPEVIWCVKNTGELIGLTYKPDAEVYAWHRHNLSGNDKVLSVNSLTRDLNYEQLHIVVEREIKGRIVRTIERMADSSDYPIPEDFYTDKANYASDTDLYKRVLLEKQKEYIHVDGDYTHNGINSSSLTLSDVTGEIDIQASLSPFNFAEVGQQIWEKNITGSERGRAVITEVINNARVNCTVLVDFSTTDILANEWFLTTDKIENINHLNGRTVRVITDGAVHPERTVIDGRIELDYQASVIHIGMGYTGIVKSTDINSVQYFTQTKPKNAYKFSIKLLDTIGLSYGTNLYTVQRLPFRTSSSYLNNPPELYTGTKDVTFSDGWNGSKNIVLLQEQSLPCTVLMVVTYMEVGER